VSPRAAAAKAPAARANRSEQSVRLWLRLLSLHNLVDSELRRRLQEQFGCTLPQFDVLSELERAGEPQTMSQVSRQLMVSNGNLTGVVDRLLREGYVHREESSGDRRVQLISLTEAGRVRFQGMAAAHAAWLEELFGGLARGDLDAAVDDIHALRDHVRERHASVSKPASRASARSSIPRPRTP
jgi:DNA-binding MarR family transcriptional regulator